MAIFRCTECEKIFDFSMQYDIGGIVFCGKCHSIYKDKLKPKEDKKSKKYYD